MGCTTTSVKISSIAMNVILAVSFINGNACKLIRIVYIVYSHIWLFYILSFMFIQFIDNFLFVSQWCMKLAKGNKPLVNMMS